MPAFAAVRRAGFNIGALVIAIRLVIFALGAALATGADQSVSAFGACGTAACACVLHAFAGAGIDMKAVDTLQDFACALRACARLPACDGRGAGTSMQTAVFNVIELACIFINVHVFGA